MSEIINPTGVTCIWGGRGAGKTTLAKKLIMPQIKGRRIAVIDPQGNSDESHYTAKSFAQSLYAGDRNLTLCNDNPSEVIPAVYAAWAHSSKNDPIYIICDEAPAYFDKDRAHIKRIMFQGRHRGFGMAILGQKPTAVSANIRSQAELTFWMRLTDFNDVETASKTIGPRAKELNGFKAGQYIAH